MLLAVQFAVPAFSGKPLDGAHPPFLMFPLPEGLGPFPPSFLVLINSINSK